MTRPSRTGRAAPAVAPANPFVRTAGVHAPARAVLVRAAPRLEAAGFTLLAPAPQPDERAADDYAQIDPTLAVDPPPSGGAAAPEPASGLGYAGLTPAQRERFLHWLAHSHQDAPPAFRQLYLAHLETALLEAAGGTPPARDVTANGATGGVIGGVIDGVIAALRQLDAWPQWRADPQRTRTLLLAFRLQGDGVARADSGAALADWIATGAPHPSLAGVALGQQAQSGTPLDAREVVALARLWNLTPAPPTANVVALRLHSLAHSLGAEPLAHALAALGADARAPLPWRCAHRDLRMALPQPDLRPVLEPLLVEMLDDVTLAGNAVTQPGTGATESAEAGPAPEEDEAEAGASAWNVILEFGHSRSEYFEFALKRAQNLPGYSVLMDEQRHMVHRVRFRKSEMRRFWPLWDLVQGWTGTRVYANGVELEKWKVWPYSQYLR